MEQWYVLQSKPQKETLLYEQLCLREIEAYYPCIRVKPVNPRARKIKSYFPGYMFVHVDLDLLGISPLQWIPGAVGLVNFGGEPATVNESILQAIRWRIEKKDPDSSSHQGALQLGDTVSICEGPFSGYKAIFDTHLSGSQRVRVLLEVIKDHQLLVELPAGQIQRMK